MLSLKNNRNQGFFITFEGSEAVGKSTIIKQVSEFLQAEKIDFIQTREPGGTIFAEKIRDIIFHDILKPSATTELLLLFAARRDHIEKIIRPAYIAKKVILCDRYIDSSYVYQSVMNNIPEHIIDNLVDNFIKPTLPDLCFIIDCNGQTSYERIQKRGIENHNDDKSVDYFNRLRDGFLNRSQINKSYPYIVIENNNLTDAVSKIIDYLSKY